MTTMAANVSPRSLRGRFWPNRSNIQRLQAREVDPGMRARRFRAIVNRLLAA
jgi:hypothetical protein